MTGCKRLLPAAIGLMLLLGACGPRIIPDDTLALIIRDVFLVNAYQEQAGLGFSLDSVDIYEPILDRYGYTNEDFRRSLNSMALKKSSRLSELIDLATADIAAENDLFVARDRLQARIDSALLAMYRDTVYRREGPPIVVRRKSDTDSLRLQFPARQGSYRLEYAYRIDSADANGYIPGRYYVLDSLDRSLLSRSTTLSRYRHTKYGVDIAAGSGADSLRIWLADYSTALFRPDITVDSIYVIYTAPLVENRDRYVRQMLGFDPRDTLYRPYGISLWPAPDSGALHILLPVEPSVQADPADRAEL
jgi:hypothetical protein